MITLALDASTYDGTVAVIGGRTLLAEEQAVMRGSSSDALMPAVQGALRAAGVAIADIDRIVCGEGPGSFTSLRIAGSIAKGIAYGAFLPLHPISSLALMVGAKGGAGEGARYLAVIDALRGQWYAAVVVRGDAGDIVSASPAMLVDDDQVAVVAEREGATIIGGRWSSDRPHARGALRLDGIVGAAADLAAWEPVYGRLAEAQVKWEAAHGRPLPE